MRRFITSTARPDRSVRMRNNEIVELFDLVPPYTPVHIRG
jgi:lipoprotein-anchoring transpeptidase ErfK/SrfK